MESIVPVFAMVCAGIAIVSTVLYHFGKYKEIKTLREIRDRLPRN